MKKLLIIFCLSILTACSDKPDPIDISGTIADYYPFLPDTIFVYEGNHTYASYNVYNTIVSEDRTQKTYIISSDMGATMTTEVLSYENGELRFINGDPYYYHFEDMTRLTPTADTLILKEPLDYGEKWLRDSNTVSEITGVGVEVTVPYGTFLCIEVTSENTAAGRVTTDYYAKGIGLIKTNNKTDDLDITSELKDMAIDTQLPVMYNYFFPDKETGEVNISQNLIEIRTNYRPSEVINTALTQPHIYGIYEPLVSQNVFIGADIDYTNYSAIIHLTDAVYNNTFTNAEDERTYLHCLALVIGGLIAAEEAAVYVNGQPYSGSFFKLGVEEGFITNFEKLAQLLQEEQEQ